MISEGIARMQGLVGESVISGKGIERTQGQRDMSLVVSEVVA